MDRDVLNYKCPCCGAGLRFDGASQMLKCDSCGNEYSTEVLKEAEEALSGARKDKDIVWPETGEQAREWSGAEKANMRAYSCPSCGAEIVVDQTTTATECAYCGNPSIMPAEMSGANRPDGIIPFVKSKQEAQEAFRALYRGKKLLPKGYASESRVEKITGVYVPFWLFQCDAQAQMTFRARIDHARSTRTENIVDTEHFLVMRGGTLSFDHVPVDGSVKFDDTLMEAIEPYDYSAEASFSTGYLPGYQAERPDVDAKACQPRADERIKSSVEHVFEDTLRHYTGYARVSSDIRLDSASVKNVLMPVWMLNTRYRNKDYVFAMNGQTGRIVGEFPVSKSRMAKWFFGITAAAGVCLTAISYALCLTGVM